jgi:hypothetical protein
MFMLVYLSREHNCWAFFVVNDWNSLDIFVHLTRLRFADLCASIRLHLSKILGPWVGLWVGFLVSVIIKIFFYGRESMGMFFKNKHMIYIRVIWSEILVKQIYHFLLLVHAFSTVMYSQRWNWWFVNLWLVNEDYRFVFPSDE